MKAALSLKLELGVRSQESGGKSQKEEGKRKKAGARISVFTNMRCSHWHLTNSDSNRHNSLVEYTVPAQGKSISISLDTRI
ncbi:hypothetical protein QUA82_19700 [Microcoleus sp. F8-D3]